MEQCYATADRSSGINSEVYRVTLSAEAQTNQMAFYSANGLRPKENYKSNPRVSQSHDLSQAERAFQLLMTKLKPTNKQQQHLKAASVRTWQNISREETAFGDVRDFQTSGSHCQGFSSI